MRIWVVRAGPDSDQNEAALGEGAVVIGSTLLDLRAYSSPEQIGVALSANHPNAGRGLITRWANQDWRFSKELQIGDLVCLPLRRQRAIAVGLVSGDYTHEDSARQGFKHRRSVRWIHTVARDSVPDQLRSSFDHRQTVYEITSDQMLRLLLAPLDQMESAKPPSSPDAASEVMTIENTKVLSTEELHSLIRRSIAVFQPSDGANGFRALLESGSCEDFLTALLFMQIHSAGYPVSREFGLGGRRAVDLAVHHPSDHTRDLYIEAKQLHLKDGAKISARNLSNDIKRHRPTACFGVLFVVDERMSNSFTKNLRFGGANRRTRNSMDSVWDELPDYFRVVFPGSPEQCLLQSFDGEGKVHLYAVVVADPAQ